MEWLGAVLRVALGGWFFYSGWLKVFETGLDDFTRAVANYRVLVAPWDAVLAYAVPWVEMVAGLCLVLGFWRRGALWTLAGLVGVFAFGVGQAWLRNLDIACGCDGNPDAARIHYGWKFAEFGLYGVAMVLVARLGRRGGGHVFGGKKMKLPD
ncbi:MAG: DoxX family protein [Verrucomicrobia bacterium]|nr:MAG: DoxX family protein [Verrucomicrobiota bacterium]TAE86536.1 MAG: DoxX family protein [Verrucomicrobiota bacterium]TAF24231.1 MAG: DoxX family protein [Verrucomicrobiota bacterium]